MNDIVQSWSLPWHTLQRRMAAAAAMYAPGSAAGNRSSALKALNPPSASSAAHSWLARAHARAYPVARRPAAK